MSEGRKAVTTDLLEEFLSSEHPTLRAYGRLCSTNLPEVIQEWVSAEQDRKTNPIEIMMALVNVSAAVVGSIAAHTVRPDGDEKVADLFRVMAARRVVEHAADIRCQLKAQRS